MAALTDTDVARAFGATAAEAKERLRVCLVALAKQMGGGG